jgi:hypothetical protein
MVQYWLRMYVLLIPYAAVVCVVAAVYLAITGDSSEARNAAFAAVGCVVGYGLARLALRRIENNQASAALPSSD